ncbi:hypothetical protein DM02DRAFT_714603 [Periconia macrospinosa]|uniref:Pentatricopeptide repeat protein n=1 Tax=Periconia macrospinosa TaxID=97972 RepID=A0A2V1EBP0_9PLEO|nr:hypothetical protein DM02DRAFT_714603 [Periconia macrospinosa]
MLALWFRAMRSPGTCRCISCIPEDAILASRPSLRSSRLIGSPTSTFAYTSVFAAGLAIDAQAKQKRNEQWDAAFGKLRDEMGQPLVDDKGIHVAQANLDSVEEVHSPGIDIDMLHQVAGMELVETQLDESTQLEADSDQVLESFWDHLRFDTRFPGSPNQNLTWPANTGPDLIKHYLPPQSLWSLDHMRWTALRKRQTWKKLAMQELAVTELIHALLTHSGVRRLPDKAFESLSPVIRSIACLSPEENSGARHHIHENMDRLAVVPTTASSEEIRDIKSIIMGIGNPTYHQDSDGDFYGIVQQMNTAIRKLFKEVPESASSYNASGFYSVLVKVCHNLLISTSAPDLQTFNLLLAGLKRQRRVELVPPVIRAFYRCKIRPNEITCAIILDHYIETNDPDSFSKFVAHMRGFGNALMLARPDITINEVGQSRLNRISEDKVYQQVHPTPLVFKYLMIGVLKFAGFDRAVDIYFEMKDNGWGLDTLGLSEFLNDCVQRADWNGGMLIWEEISSIKQTIEISHMAKAYSKMLSLCSVTGNTIAFNQLLNEVARRGLDRRRIMKSVMAAESRMRGQTEVSLAPAWTADNLLIAISDFMGTDQQEMQSDDISMSTSEQNEPPGSGQAAAAPHERGAPEESGSVEQHALNPEQAWAKWLQHELGEPAPDETRFLSIDPVALSGLMDFPSHFHNRQLHAKQEGSWGPLQQEQPWEKSI